MAEQDEKKKEYARQVGERIVKARNELGGMRQAELADLIHVSERSMQAYEAGEVVPYRKLKELSDVLNRPMSWILHGDSAASTGEVGLLRDIRDRMDTIIGILEGKAPVSSR